MSCIKPYTEKPSPYSQKDTPFTDKENPYSEYCITEEDSS